MSCEGEDCGRLSGTRRAVEEHVRELKGVLMIYDILYGIDTEDRLTFVDDSVFDSTPTICSCAEISSIVFGRLGHRRFNRLRILHFPTRHALFLHPRLQRRVNNMLRLRWLLISLGF